jgi:hypothetical protein
VFRWHLGAVLFTPISVPARTAYTSADEDEVGLSQGARLGAVRRGSRITMNC